MHFWRDRLAVSASLAAAVEGLSDADALANLLYTGRERWLREFAGAISIAMGPRLDAMEN